MNNKKKNAPQESPAKKRRGHERISSIPEKYASPIMKKKFMVEEETGVIDEEERKARLAVKWYEYDYSKVNVKQVDKFRLNVKNNIEESATGKYLHRQTMLHGEKAAKLDTSFKAVVKEYSGYTFEKREEMKGQVEELRKAANEASRWAIQGPGAPNAARTRMRHAMIEKYGAYAIDLGIQNEMDTELNMSPEGKLRRKALYQKDEADKRFKE